MDRIEVLQEVLSNERCQIKTSPSTVCPALQKLAEVFGIEN